MEKYTSNQPKSGENRGENLKSWKHSNHNHPNYHLTAWGYSFVMPWQHLITSIHIEECSWECIRGHRNAYWIWWTSNIWLIHEEFRKVFFIHWFLCLLWCHHIRGVNWKGAFSADTGCITVGAPAVDVVEAMVERLCRLVSHRDGTKFSKRCSLELLKQDLAIQISAGGFNCRKFQVSSTTMLKSGEAFWPPLFAVPPELAPTLLAVHGGLAASPQRRPQCGAAWDQNILLD